MSETSVERVVAALLCVRRAFADVILSDAELGVLRLISRNGPRRRSGPSGDFGPELTEEASVVGPHELLDEPTAGVEPEHVHEVPDDPCSVRLELPHG